MSKETRPVGSAWKLVVFLLPLLLAATTLPRFGDWEGETDFGYNILLAAAHTTIVEHHQFPLWNPYAKGGISFSSDPGAEHLSPTFPLHIVLGPYRGVLAEYIFFAIVGALGLVLLAREMGASRGAALLPGLVFAVSNSLPVYLVNGWFNHMAHAWIPLAMWLCIRMAKGEGHRARTVAILGVVLGFLILEADPYHYLYLLAWIGVVAAMEVARSRRGRPFLWVAVVTLVSLGIAAARILPITWLGEGVGIREWTGFSFSPIAALRALITWDNSSTLWESVGYVGPVVFVLAGIGIASQWRRVWPLIVPGGMFFVYSLGSHILPPLWFGTTLEVRPDPNIWSFGELLQALPVLGAIRNPSRALVMVSMALLPISALGLDTLRSWFETRLRRSGGIVVVGTLLLAVLPAHRAARGYLVEHMIELDTQTEGRHGDLPARSETFHQVAWTPGPASLAPLLNVGTLGVELPFRSVPPAVRTMGETDYQGEMWWTGSGEVKLAHWSPNELEFRIEGQGPGRLVVNQAHARGWSAEGDVSGPPIATDGLLSVEATAPGTVRLVYRSAIGMVGAWLTLLSALGALWMARRRAG